MLAFGAFKKLCWRLVACARLDKPVPRLAIQAFRAFFVGFWQVRRVVFYHDYGFFLAFCRYFCSRLFLHLEAAAPAPETAFGRLHRRFALFAELYVDNIHLFLLLLFHSRHIATRFSTEGCE